MHVPFMGEKLFYSFTARFALIVISIKLLTLLLTL